MSEFMKPVSNLTQNFFACLPALVGRQASPVLQKPGGGGGGGGFRQRGLEEIA